MSLTRNRFIYFSCYFDIDQGHSDHFKWCIVQTEASPRKSGSNVKTRSEMGNRFSGSGLKNQIFWSEIGSGFWEPCSTPPPKTLGSTPLPTPHPLGLLPCHGSSSTFSCLLKEHWGTHPHFSVYICSFICEINYKFPQYRVTAKKKKDNFNEISYSPQMSFSTTKVCLGLAIEF